MSSERPRVGDGGVIARRASRLTARLRIVREVQQVYTEHNQGAGAEHNKGKGWVGAAVRKRAKEREQTTEAWTQVLRVIFRRLVLRQQATWCSIKVEGKRGRSEREEGEGVAGKGESDGCLVNKV